MKKNKTIILIAIILTSISWGRILWQTIFKMSPARRMEYIVGENATWESKSFPHANYPRLIDKDSVWIYGMYGKDINGEQSGFIRFNLKKGIAEMRWPFPGKSRYARILGATRHKSGKIAVVWSPHLGKPRVDILLPKGGLNTLGQIPTEKRNLKIIGIHWVKGRVEIASGDYKEKSTYIYRSKATSGWQKRSIIWKGTPRFRFVPQVAWFNQNGWETIFVEWKLKQPKKAYAAAVFSYKEDAAKSTKIGNINITSRNIFYLIDGILGNILYGSFLNKLQYQIHQGKLIKLSPGPIAKLKGDSRLDTYHRVFLFKNYFLERQLIWKGKYPLNPVIQSSLGEMKFNYKRTARARNRRYAMFIQMGKQYSKAIVEGFRFRGTPPVVVPAEQGSFWLLGTFGSHVKVNHKLERIDNLSFISRYKAMIQKFNSRSAQYDDSLLSGAFLKKLIIPLLHFSFLICGFIVFLMRRKKPREKIINGLKNVALSYIVLWVVLIYWFWKITVNF